MCGWCFTVLYNHFINFPLGQLVRMSLVRQGFLSWSLCGLIVFCDMGRNWTRDFTHWRLKSVNKGVVNLICFSQSLIFDSVCLLVYDFCINSRRMFSWLGLGVDMYRFLKHNAGTILHFWIVSKSNRETKANDSLVCLSIVTNFSNPSLAQCRAHCFY